MNNLEQREGVPHQYNLCRSSDVIAVEDKYDIERLNSMILRSHTSFW